MTKPVQLASSPRNRRNFSDRSEVLRRFAARGARLFVVGRRAEALHAAAADLRIRGASEVESAALDANDIAQHAPVLDTAWSKWAGLDVALIAHGVLPDQLRAEISRGGAGFLRHKRPLGDCASDGSGQSVRGTAMWRHRSYLFAGRGSRTRKQLCLRCRQGRSDEFHQRTASSTLYGWCTRRDDSARLR